MQYKHVFQFIYRIKRAWIHIINQFAFKHLVIGNLIINEWKVGLWEHTVIQLNFAADAEPFSNRTENHDDLTKRLISITKNKKNENIYVCPNKYHQYRKRNNDGFTGFSVLIVIVRFVDEDKTGEISFCFTGGTRHVSLDNNSVISHKCEKKGMVIRTTGCKQYIFI